MASDYGFTTTELLAAEFMLTSNLTGISATYTSALTDKKISKWELAILDKCQLTSAPSTIPPGFKFGALQLSKMEMTNVMIQDGFLSVPEYQTYPESAFDKVLENIKKNYNNTEETSLYWD